MAELIIKNTSQSFQQILIDLNLYLRSKPDWDAWRDYFETGSGTTMLELIAGLGATLFYFINIQRQETYLQTALNRTSVIGISQTLGYSANRGSVVKTLITITPNTTKVINKFDILGICKNVDIVAADNYLIYENEPIQIEVFLGRLNRAGLDVITSDLTVFRFTEENISSDYRLYKTQGSVDISGEYPDKSDWVELPTSEIVFDLSNDKYVLQTNVIGSVDIFYLNKGSGVHKYQYNTGDFLILEYIELANCQFTLNDLDFEYGHVESVDSIRSYTDVESLSSIKINSSLSNESQRLVRARADAKKNLEIEMASLVSSTSFRDLSPEIVEVTYIKNDYTALTTLEYNEIYEYLYKCRAFGIKMPIISPPVRGELELEITVKITNPLVSNDITTQISSMIEQLQGIFFINEALEPVALDLEDLENRIEDLYGVKIARVNLVFNNWSANTYFRQGQFINPIEGGFYKLDDVKFKSGANEPAWPTIVGTTVDDGNIRWVTVVKNYADSEVPPEWKANTVYSTGNTILPSVENGYMYEFKCYISKTGTTEPGLPSETTPEVTYDEAIVWFKIDRDASAVDWSANTWVAIGDIVNISSDTENSYECSVFRGKTGNTEPEWETTNGDNGTVPVTSVVDNDITWTYYSNVTDIEDSIPLLNYPWNQYLKVIYTVNILS